MYIIIQMGRLSGLLSLHFVYHLSSLIHLQFPLPSFIFSSRAISRGRKIHSLKSSSDVRNFMLQQPYNVQDIISLFHAFVFLYLIFTWSWDYVYKAYLFPILFTWYLWWWDWWILLLRDLFRHMPLLTAIERRQYDIQTMIEEEYQYILPLSKYTYLAESIKDKAKSLPRIFVLQQTVIIVAALMMARRECYDKDIGRLIRI